MPVKYFDIVGVIDDDSDEFCLEFVKVTAIITTNTAG